MPPRRRDLAITRGALLRSRASAAVSEVRRACPRSTRKSSLRSDPAAVRPLEQTGPPATESRWSGKRGERAAKRATSRGCCREERDNRERVVGPSRLPRLEPSKPQQSTQPPQDRSH